MHIYILGICGTFMGSLAILAREMGYQVSGCDTNVYPPMSTQLENAGIALDQGFEIQHLDCNPDLIVIGNAMSRGNPLVEYVLDRGLPYTSGPQFLHDYVLREKWVLAVAGTHGKTTTSSMLAFILDYAGMKPGFLIGGVVQDFPFSARIGESPFFVVEADEYDTAFFDKRSKFLHYSPRTLILNNLEFDHADIFENLDAIKKQFHHLLRIVPATGRVIVNQQEANLADVLAKGCWSEQVSFGENGQWQAQTLANGDIEIFNSRDDKQRWTLSWALMGEHNTLNALAAIAAAEHVGVRPETAVEALSQFNGVKRRMEKIADVHGICLYDDFAHHPTAIETTLAGLKAKVAGRIIAVLEPRSNTMKMGVHKEQLSNSVALADQAFWYVNGMQWQLNEQAGQSFVDLDALITAIITQAKSGDHIVFMSNGGFGGIHQKVKQALEQRYG